MKPHIVENAKQGNVVVFDTLKLRVEKPPEIRRNRIYLSGRINRDGCPFVTRGYLIGTPCQILENERAE